MQREITIRSRSDECFKLFDQCRKSLEEDDFELTKDGLQDEFVRFRLWLSGNGVFANVQLSLDFRVREIPDLRDSILNHLGTIHYRLAQFSDIVSKSRQPNATIAQEDICDGSNQENPPGSITLETQNNPFESWTAAELLDSIKKNNNWLERLSNAIETASIVNQNARAAEFRLEGFNGGSNKLTEAYIDVHGKLGGHFQK
ncbi:hypothetical protein CFAM422_000176 [Trichoderma lentiforme]|uniref:Uncharacterized protein n=1 Tax=Trichoderma lentiforme TaxID=1567552 RepID=A0A9P4XQS4_9HYPO|nr:hypothetical protein CFAM422_000176 [Trichoderma lentiforme]